ncbi:hypothetical protein NP511_08265 [Natrinema thermotolerans]|uniref:Uncharacterized protein n=1 Tax=Natrinema thermotolerans TaxID=121872 RepID=A0AAF0PFR1_9EURY|nr:MULTISPECIES: hypothetical protein [Natrinema]ELZ11887.1 hypothetical protein C478_11975 [Natrinema thermotolerans DSM 11552]WMT09614.1 hypothetical protein NP511_08265 [Natrinema thermotolerans]
MLRVPQHAIRRCPQCGLPLANVQGIDACPDCQWITDRPDRPRCD